MHWLQFIIVFLSFHLINMFSLSTFSLSQRSLSVLNRKIIHRNLNRILFEQEEVHLSENECYITHIPKADNRVQHIEKILKLKVGDTLRTGIIDIGMSNKAVIEDLSDGITINLGNKDDLYSSPVPEVDLLLALPRPQKLEKLLPIISCLGVRNVFLVDACKVEKDYFGSHLLRNPAKMRQLLIEGLCQAEVDCTLPKVRVVRNLKEFLLHELKKELPVHSGYRLIAHPPTQEYNLHKLCSTTTRSDTTTSSSSNYISGGSSNATSRSYRDNQETNEKIGISESSIGYVHSMNSLRFSEYTDLLLSEQPTTSVNTITDENYSDTTTTATSTTATPTAASRSMLLAVGPEGGWLPSEVALFQQQRFQLVHLGNRILRTDIAVPVLLGLAHEFQSCINTQNTKR